MKKIIVVLILACVCFSCGLDLWEPNLEYVIEGTGIANISYTHPQGSVITEIVNLPWSIIFQSETLRVDKYIFESDNGNLFIYNTGEIVSSGINHIEWIK